MLISVSVVQLVVLSVVSIAPAGIIVWTTFKVMREPIKDLDDDRANICFRVAAETIYPA